MTIHLGSPGGRRNDLDRCGQLLGAVPHDQFQGSNKGYHVLNLWLFIYLALGMVGFDRPSRAATIEKPLAVELFNEQRITAVEVEVSTSDYEELKSTQKFKGMGERKSYAVTVREGTNVYRRVAMHLKGAIGSFRPIDQNPALTLTFNKHLAHQRFHGLEKISLNNSVQDPGFVSERLARELFMRSGVPVPRVGFASLKLNGKDLGLYLLVEGYNRQFLKQHFANADGNLYDGGLGEEIDTEGRQPVNSGRNPKDQKRLRDLISAAEEADLGKRWTRFQQTLDLERFFTVVAVDVLIGNWDGYALGRNNYRVFHDLEHDRLVFLPHGLDQTFQNPDSTILPRMPGLVARALIEIPEARQRYLDRMRELAGQWLTPVLLTNRVREITKASHQLLMARGAKEAADHEEAVGGYCTKIMTRCASVARQLDGARHPLRFDSNVPVPLADWTPATEFGKPAFGETNSTPKILEISVGDGPGIGSWQARVWLEKGTYQFQGRVRTEEVGGVDGDPRGGATLRSATRPAIESKTGTMEWTPMTFEFQVLDPLFEVTLRCELRAERGRAWFDRESLKLLRLPDP